MTDTTAPGLSLAEARELPAHVNPARAYLARLASAESQRTQESALRCILALMTPDGTEVPTVDTFAWPKLRAEHAGAIAAAIGRAGHKPSTVRRMTSALRGVLTASWRLGYMTAEELARSLDLPPVRGSTLPTGQALEAHEVSRLLAACDTTPQGARDAAMVALLFGGGLRRAEVATVRMETLDRAKRTMHVMGKGHKERLVPLGGWLDILGAWLDVRGAEPGPIICRMSRWKPPEPARRVGPMAIYKRLKALGARCGVEFTPHDGRRTAITDLIAAGVSLSLAQKFAGHSSPKTTAGYDKSKDQALIDAIDRADTSKGRAPSSLSTETPTRP